MNKKAVQPILLIWSYALQTSQHLPQGYLVAHLKIHLVLLPSDPDTVRGMRLHKTKAFNNVDLAQRQKPKYLDWYSAPPKADCGLQGTASTPPSTTNNSI